MRTAYNINNPEAIFILVLPSFCFGKTSAGVGEENPPVVFL